MNILGIDYGRRKIGLSWASGSFAEPYKVVHYKDTNELYKLLRKITEELEIEKIILGVSEGEMAIEITNFAKVLKKELRIGVEFFDETLSSRDAQALSMHAGIKRKRRKEMEDAYAATIMLQGYLDNNLQV